MPDDELELFITADSAQALRAADLARELSAAKELAEDDRQLLNQTLARVLNEVSEDHELLACLLMALTTLTQFAVGMAAQGRIASTDFTRDAFSAEVERVRREVFQMLIDRGVTF